MSDATAAHRGKWIFTYSGKKFWPLDPRAEDMGVKTIAYALSKQCRYAGHTSRFYSVLEHCLWLVVAYLLRNEKWSAFVGDDKMNNVVDIVRLICRRLRRRGFTPEEVIVALWLLLHDATETWFQDMLRPIKAELPEYRFMEDRATDVVAARFRLPLPIPGEVDKLDKQIVVDEVMALGPQFEEISPDGEMVPGSWLDQIDWMEDKTPVGIPLGLMGKADMDAVAEAFLTLLDALEDVRARLGAGRIEAR